MIGIGNKILISKKSGIVWVGGNISGASYDSKSFDMSGQSSSPFAIFLKSDGTKVYILNYTGVVYQYSLSTAWDISTASYDSKSFDMSGQDANSSGIFIKPDGTKMYMMGYSSDTVYQYSLSTEWDISTASYDSKSKTVTSQDSAPIKVFIKPDGTKMYILGSSNDTVYQYSLSTEWDISTASYDSKSKNINSQDTIPRAISFRPDGTKMYSTGLLTDKIYQYSLSTAWDVSTASYDSNSKDISSQDSDPLDLVFKPDGTKMYMLGNSNDLIFQYSL